MRKRCTLFHIDSERGLRGGERQLLYLATQLRALGHANVVVCRAGAPLEGEAARLGLETMTLPFLGEWDPLSAWRLRRAASSRERPLLHAHTAHAASLAFLASRFGGPPWVVHRRVDFHLSGFLSRRLKYEAASRVVAVSECVRRLLAEDGIPPGKVSVLPDCLPLTAAEAALAGESEPLRPPTASERTEARRALAAEFGLPADRPWVANLAALVPHKDQATLLRAVPAVLAERECLFLILGSGPLEGELKALARGLGLSETVRFMGYQPDPGRWLKALDLFVLSSWGEGMGSVLLEALACGVPIVATRAGGIPEVLEDGLTALLAPPRDPEGLAAAMRLSLADREAAGRRARAGLRRLADFSASRAAERMSGIYEAIAG